MSNRCYEFLSPDKIFTHRLPNNLTQFTLAESYNLYLQSAVTKTNILGRFGSNLFSQCLVQDPIRPPLFLQLVLELTVVVVRRMTKVSLPRVFNNFLLPRSL
jgi:hypothetical protein